MSPKRLQVCSPDKNVSDVAVSIEPLSKYTTRDDKTLTSQNIITDTKGFAFGKHCRYVLSKVS